MRKPLHPSLSALLEIGILFLPAIPAYLWVWPKLEGVPLDIFQVFVYLYVLAGTLFIGLRRWNWDQLGLNRQGIWLTLACALFILGGRLMIIFSLAWGVPPPQFTWLHLAGNLVYYFGLVGLTEELLFRGVIYRLLEDWKGVRWAIWGSSFGFLLWHIFGQGPLAGGSALLIGLLFALIRWRAGGIVGLIILHALWDLENALLVSDTNAEILSPENIASMHQTITQHQILVLTGTILMLVVPVYLWFVHPRVEGWWRGRKKS
jgi:membrane protease YdiL (CAAX protease family)